MFLPPYDLGLIRFIWARATPYRSNQMFRVILWPSWSTINTHSAFRMTIGAIHSPPAVAAPRPNLDAPTGLLDLLEGGRDLLLGMSTCRHGRAGKCNEQL